MVSTETNAHSIGGKLSVEGSTALLVISSGASGAGTPILNISGNLEISAGTLDLGTSTGTPLINVTGNFNMTGGLLKRTNSSLVSINLNGNWTNDGGTFRKGNRYFPNPVLQTIPHLKWNNSLLL